MADTSAAQLTKLTERLRVAPGSKVKLGKDHDPADTGSWRHQEESEQHLQASVELLAEYQDRLAAQDTYGLLVVIQGMDAAGKDSIIRHVLSGVNPQGVVVHSFKVPSSEELDHHYLWRCELRVPARGQIGIFNRSHYEEVLVTRVHPELIERSQIPPAARKGDIWERRFREINDWERMLVGNGIRVVKLFVNVSREEQRTRFLERIDTPEKHWKFSAGDVAEREHWDEYQHAYAELLEHTSTEVAPWYVIPADHKWFAHIAAGAILAQALREIDPQYPTVDREELEQGRAALEAEASSSD